MSSAVPGSGAGAGNPVPSIFELETRADVLLARAYLGIVPDTLDVPFSDMDKTRLWKYTAESSNPFIMPLNRLRVLMKAEQKLSDIWVNAFQKMVEMLSEEARDALLRELKLPLELRDPAFGALDKMLGWMASTYVWLEANSSISQTEKSEFAENSSKLTTGAVKESQLVVGGALDFLNEVGQAQENFDRLQEVAALLQGYAAELALAQKPLPKGT